MAPTRARSLTARATAGADGKVTPEKAPGKAPDKAPGRAKRPTTTTGEKPVTQKPVPAKTAAKNAAKTAAKKTDAAKAGTTKASAKRASRPAAASTTTPPATSAATTPATPARADRTSHQQASEKVTRRVLKKATAKDLVVKAGEDPWSNEELTEVRDELQADRERLRAQLNLAEHELHDLMRDAGDGAGHDQADVGSTTFERDQEMSLAKNAREMLAQTEHALLRIDDGSYGVCESCAEPIGKMRVMAFPRATLCLSCKQREERR
jgi:RNA polymerase-binding protein DksA